MAQEALSSGRFLSGLVESRQDALRCQILRELWVELSSFVVQLAELLLNKGLLADSYHLLGNWKRIASTMYCNVSNSQEKAAKLDLDQPKRAHR